DLAFAEASRRFLEHREAIGLKPGTLADYESYLRVHLAPTFGTRTLADISVEEIDAWITAEIGAGSAAKSVINYLALLQAIFTHAVKRGWCPDNPVARVDKPRRRRDPEIRYLTLP